MAWEHSAMAATLAMTTALLGACTLATRGATVDAPPAVSVTAGPAAQALRDADREVVEKLDGLIRRRWDEGGIVVAPSVDDYGFLRRVQLDLVGRVPSPEEIERFFALPRDSRRERWVALLLNDREHADYWAWRLYDLLFDVRVQEAPRMTSPARMWLREQVDGNRPWDEIVRSLLTATGELEYVPATSFTIAHLQISGLEGLTTTISDRLLGVQLACAQCHDHPYASWTRQDFWSVAAGLAGARVRAEPVDPKFTRLHLEETLGGQGRIAAEFGVDAKQAPAPALMGLPVTAHKGESRRDALVRTMLDTDLVAKAMVARTWTDLFGRGLHEPWNDLGGPNETHSAELEHLAAAFRESSYDVRRLLQVLTATQAYSRSSEGVPETRDAAVQSFARAAVRPLNSHQVYRSLVRVTGLDQVPPSVFLFVAHAPEDSLRQRYERVFDDGCTRSVEQTRVELAQSLAVLNDGITHLGSQARHGLALAQLLEGRSGVEHRIHAVYLRVLSRPPRPEEVERAKRLVHEAGEPDAYEDLVYALLNSAEFLTNH